MRKLILFSLMSLLIINLTGCSFKKPKIKDATGQPAWVTNPRLAGNLVGLGSAKQHFNGPSAQRELAMSRALDELARQQGVNVSSILVTHSQASSAGTSSKLASQSEQTTQGVKVTARIYDEYHNGNELFILMVAD